MLLNLLLLSRLGTALGFTLFEICLERRNLPVDTCNVLLDDKSEFLKVALRNN